MNRPRVLHILTRLGMGGSARQVIEISRRILGSFDVAIATGPEEEGEGSLHREAVAARIPVWVIPSLRRRGYLLRDRRALRELARILRSLQPAVVHTHHAKAGVLGRMAARQAKVGCTVHTFHEPLERLDRDGLLHKANVAAERRLAEATGRLIAVSESVKADLVSHEVADPAKIAVIAPLIEPARFRPARLTDVRRAAGIPADAPLVGMVGRLVRAKDPALFLKVFAAIASALPEARAIVAGDGPERSAIERTARKMDLSERISFLGWTSDVADVYDALDLLIVTSRREGFALAAVEAMSAGTAVVGTRVMGVQDVIRHGHTGLLAEPGDAEGLAAAALTLLRDPARRRHLAGTALDEVARRAASADQVPRIEALYRSLLRSGRARPSAKLPRTVTASAG